METAAATGPEELWTEDGDVLWLRADLAPTRSKARYAAFVGKVEGDYVFNGPGMNDCVDRLIDLKVKVQYLRDTSNVDPWDEFPWYICDKNDEGAVKYWRIEA